MKDKIKKALIIVLGVMIYLILFAFFPKPAGVLTIIGTITLGIYLFTKNQKFKDRGKIYKSLTVIGLMFLILFGSAGISAQNESIRLEARKQEQQKQEKRRKEAIKKTRQKQERLEKERKEREKKEEEEKQEKIKKFNLVEAKVIRVVDGDTIVANIENKDYKVRFIGMNTPESTTRHEPYGKEASDYTKDKLSGKTIYLEKDVSETDRYGRLLRYVWLDVPNEINESEVRNKMFNAILVINGYAQQSTYPPDVKYKEYFGKCAEEARKKNVGLWAINSNGTTKGDNNKNVNNSNTKSNVSSNNTNNSNNSNNNVANNTPKPKTSTTPPPAPATNTVNNNANNQAINNNQVIITMQGKKFHRPGCRTIKQIKDRVSREEALNMNYEPCKVCNP